MIKRIVFWLLGFKPERKKPFFYYEHVIYNGKRYLVIGKDGPISVIKYE